MEDGYSPCAVCEKPTKRAGHWCGPSKSKLIKLCFDHRRSCPEETHGK